MRAGSWVAALLTVILAIVSVHFYFAIYNVKQTYKNPLQEAVSIAAFEYSQLRGEGTFVLYTREGVDEDGPVHHAIIKYVADDSFLGGGPKVVDRLDASQPLYFYVLPDKMQELPRLMSRFPGGTIKEYRDRVDGQVMLTRYAVNSSAP